MRCKTVLKFTDYIPVKYACIMVISRQITYRLTLLTLIWDYDCWQVKWKQIHFLFSRASAPTCSAENLFNVPWVFLRPVFLIWDCYCSADGAQRHAQVLWENTGSVRGLSSCHLITQRAFLHSDLTVAHFYLTVFSHNKHAQVKSSSTLFKKLPFHCPATSKIGQLLQKPISAMEFK